MRTCNPSVPSFVSHSVPLPVCCPVSKNPRPGSTVRVSYLPTDTVVPVEALEEHVRLYVGGFENIRGMEEMIQDIALWCAEETGVRVRAVADLIIQPPYGGELQTMRVSARSESAARTLIQGEKP